MYEESLENLSSHFFCLKMLGWPGHTQTSTILLLKGGKGKRLNNIKGADRIMNGYLEGGKDTNE